MPKKPAVKLPALSGRNLIKTFEKRGSHIVLRHQDPPHRRLTIPDYKEIAKGTVKTIMREAGLTPEELWEIL